MSMTMATARCGRQMRAYVLGRQRESDWLPQEAICGRPAGHPGHCITRESLVFLNGRRKPLSKDQLARINSKERERYAILRGRGASRAEASRLRKSPPEAWPERYR